MGYEQPEQVVTIPVDHEFVVGRIEPDTAAYYVDDGNRRAWLTAVLPSRRLLYCSEHGVASCPHKVAAERFMRREPQLVSS